MLAVSGGLDSVVLAHLCKGHGLNFSIAHCNFCLRGAESERDEAFVRSLAGQLGVAVVVQRFDTAALAEQMGQSIQETARSLRYAWFQDLLQSGGADHYLLAHQADDRIETLLMHFFRGTGLEGLKGIPERTPDGKGLRPLLPFRRAELEGYARAEGLEWVEDSSNQTEAYTRNFFRINLLPQVRTVYPEAEANLLQNMERFQSAHALYRTGYELLAKKLVRTQGGEEKVPVQELKRVAHTSFLYEWIRRFGFGEKSVPEVIKLMNASSGRYLANGQFQIIRHRAWLIAAPVSPEASALPIESEEQRVVFAEGLLEQQRKKFRGGPADPDPHTAQLDAGKLEYPLLLRRWKEGDFFYPLGMPKKKKIARFLIDLKLPRQVKEQTWVVESAGRIVWVVGRRIDDRFKLRPHTKTMVELRWTISGSRNNTPPPG